MRVLFTTTNWTGLYLCMVPLGWALQAAGHDVRVACSPEQSPKIITAGLTPVPVFRELDVARMERTERFADAARSGRPFDDAVPLLHPETAEPVTGTDAYDIETQEPLFEAECESVHEHNFDAAVRFARDWRPGLVVHDLMTPEGVLAAEVTGVPSVYHSLGMFGSVESCPPEPTGAFPRYGIDGGRPPIRYIIDPTPDGLQSDQGAALRMRTRYLPYNGPGEMAAEIPAPPDRPRVCLLWSRSTARIFGNRVPAIRYAIEAVVSRGAELVLLGPRELVDALGDLPEGAHALPDAPLNLLLPDCAAIIHQGSGNPMMTGAVFGLPQLSMGITDDGLEMGRRFAASGAGLHLAGLNATRDEVAAAVARLLDDSSLVRAAARLRAEMEVRPTPLDLVAPLEHLARTGDLTIEDLPGPAPGTWPVPEGLAETPSGCGCGCGCGAPAPVGASGPQLAR